MSREAKSHGPEALLIRTAGRAEDHLSAVASALQSTSPDLPYVTLRPLQDLVDIQARSWRLGATVFDLFGGLALVLAAIGVYGSLAFAVRQTTPEIAVRLALGADRSDVATMVFRQVGIVILAGCAVGAIGALAAGRYLESLLFATTVNDPRLLLTSIAIIGAVAAPGTLVPLIRAWRVDPAVALRYE